MKHSRVAYFEAHTLELLDQAFQASWQVAQYSASSQATRQILAQRIMSCAASGETNPALLIAFALKGMDLSSRNSPSIQIPITSLGAVTGAHWWQRAPLAA